MFGLDLDQENSVLAHTAPDSQKPFLCLADSGILDLHFVGAASGTSCLPFYRYDADGTRHDNVTDWSLRQFQEHYADTSLTKLDVFHYTYAVLHHPAYRAKYETNLKREFPRLPFYDDFRRWAGWGKTLMALHLDYEQATPFPFERHDRPMEPARTQVDLPPDERNLPRRLSDDKPTLKPRLKADRTACTSRLTP